MKKTWVRNDYKGIALYNTEKQELVGVFGSISLVERYIYDQYTSVSGNVYTALIRKTRIKKNGLGIVLCVRVATDNQVALMEGEDYYIFPQYRQPAKTKMDGYVSSRSDMKKKGDEIMNIRGKEKKRKNGSA